MLTETLDLHALNLTFGEGTRLQLEVPAEQIELGGQTYETGGEGHPVRLDASRTSSGYALRLRFDVTVSGPCVRCLEPAGVTVRVDSREVDQPREHGGHNNRRHRHDREEDEEEAEVDAELLSPYVDSGLLDLESWARDALALALPPQVLCRTDCAGLCPECGESLNDAEPGSHDHGVETDPRWSKLREI